MKNNLYIHFLYYFQNTMRNKENECQAKRQKLGVSTRRAQKYSAGNDYVLKRYRLQENRHFKDKNGEEFTYSRSTKKQENTLEQEIEQDIIIVPLELPIQESLQQHQSPQKQEKKVNINDMVYVFDDDQQLKEESHNLQMIAIDEKEKISSKNKDEMFNDITLKGSERVNFSIAELMTPKHNKDTNLFNSRHFPKEINEYQTKIIQRKPLKNNHKKRQISTTRLQSIQGVHIEQESKQNGISINIIDKRMFSISKLPSGIVLRCIIKRTTSFFNMLSPEYDLYLANGLKHIVSAKKYPMRNRELFKFSTDPVNFMDSSLLAVMHANINHNIYWLLDLPKKINGFDVSLIRLIIGYYRVKKDCHRKFSVLLPEMKDQYLLAIDYQQTFINFDNFKEEIDLELNNLQQWQGQSKNSTKNFVIADQDDPDYRYLQMKKESDNVFELVIQHPLSPLQAMAIAMTRFDVQLN